LPERAPQALAALVCGFEKSGTKLLNEILRRHPALDSGFECGFLLGETPRQFPSIQPYCAFFRQKWRVSKEDLAYICDTDDWQECYRRVRQRAPVIADKQCRLFDKTPAYMRVLDQVLQRVEDIPCVVCVRDPRSLMSSWAHWSGHAENPQQWLEDNLEQNCERFLSYARGYEAARERHGARLYLNQFERLCLNPAPELERIFNFLGLQFDTEFLEFSSEHFVYGSTVSTDYLYPYRKSFTAGLNQEILARTAEFSHWHFHGEEDA
jgi:sulfotransferase family protein